MKHPNSVTLLHENNFGYIAKCNCCTEIKVSLGNIILSLTEQEFRDFDTFFDKIRIDFEKDKKNKDGQNNRRYYIKTYFNELILSFSYQELSETIELLNFSNIMLSVNKQMETNED